MCAFCAVVRAPYPLSPPDSKGTGRGEETQHKAPAPLAASKQKRRPDGRSLVQRGLSLNLAWIQEKNFEDKFVVVRVIGYAVYCNSVALVCVV